MKKRFTEEQTDGFPHEAGAGLPIKERYGQRESSQGALDFRARRIITLGSGAALRWFARAEQHGASNSKGQSARLCRSTRLRRCRDC
ncbi:hypothetical protein GQR88_02880 [Burkholderia glumae AU6208]|nr:hypothetical protein GQR88_02880 [Burkholderia glumae AU6208]